MTDQGTTGASSSSDPVQFLRETYRRHLETFYGTLQLAPPYHSVEKAILELTKLLHAMPLEDRRRVAEDPDAHWRLFREAFVLSGLNQKHRGILMGMAQRRDGLALAPEYHGFLDAFLPEAR